MESLFATHVPTLLKHPYSLVIAGNLFIAFHLLLVVYIYLISGRLSIFTGKFFKESGLTELHQKEYGPKTYPAKMGYPDTGCGRYSKKLSYKDWYKFNCA